MTQRGNKTAQADCEEVEKKSIEKALDNEQGKPVGKRLSPVVFLLDYLKAYPRQWLVATLALLFTSSMVLMLGQGMRYLVDAGFGGGSARLLDQAVVVLLGIGMLYAAGTYIRHSLVSWLGERVSADIRADVFNHIVALHPGYFEINNSGEIASRITTDTTLLQSIIGSSFSMALRSCINTLGGLVLLFLTNIKLMAVLLLAVPLVFFPMMLFGRRVKALSRDSQDSIADVGSYAAEIIQNIKTVQSFSQEQRERKRFSQQVERAFGIARQRIRQRSLMMACVMLLVFTALSAMLWVGGHDVINGVMTAGELASFVFYAMVVAMGIATVSEVYGELQRAAGATERLIELLNVQSLIEAPAYTPGHSDSRFSIFSNDFSNDKENDEKGASLCLSTVDFSYPSRPERKVLDDFDLRIEAGECVALVGPSGAGKTTLFELVQRFYDPDSGHIELDGINIRDVDPRVLRQQQAVVAQHPSLFTTDVAENIRYGNPRASDAQVEAAARSAFADEFICELPDGYRSFLGEQGVRLSGGQKQRIAIARAILKDPRVLMLDEATSALDSESEYQVQRALDALMHGRTTLIIAHRLSTVLHADRIIVMDKGKVVAQGKHDQLLERSPLYARLASLQFRETVDGEPLS